MRAKRTITVYGILLAVWLVVAVWQVYAHQSAQKTEQQAMRDRAEDISYAIGASIRPQFPFFPYRSISELEPTLKDLVGKSHGNLLAIALLNTAGEILASAGEPIDAAEIPSPEEPLAWKQASVYFVNPVDLGQGELDGATTQSALIVYDDEDTSPVFAMGRSRQGAQRGRRSNPEFRRLSEEIDRLRGENNNLREAYDRFLGPEINTESGRNGVRTSFTWAKRRSLNIDHDENRNSFTLYLTTPYRSNRRGGRRSSNYQDESSREGRGRESMQRSGRGSGRGRGGRDGSRNGGREGGQRGDLQRNDDRSTGSEQLNDNQQAAVQINFRNWPGRRRGRGMFSMTPEEFQELREKRELHSFILLMSTEAYHAENFRDFLLRLGMAVLALAAVTGLGLAWRNIERSGGLQLRLVRASEMNVHLREMNIAAAGLAHETRNPLNIVRGLAQMIGKSTGVSSEIRSQSVEITEEVDRVTSRLNEFIDYSKPQEAKPAPTNLNAIIQDVERTLESDQQEKGIQFELHGPELTVEADEGLLRQVLFNLLLNSIQAVDQDGRIEVHVQKVGASEAALEICDNGPGVPAEARDNIFRPYFTTTKGGAGLGLAVVRQIVLAHRWEINYLPGDSGGSRFRISGLKLA